MLRDYDPYASAALEPFGFSARAGLSLLSLSENATYRVDDPADGRFTLAILTDEGFRLLAGAAPGHVAHVRSLVIDVLSPEQLRRVGPAGPRPLAP